MIQALTQSSRDQETARNCRRILERHMPKRLELPIDQGAVLRLTKANRRDTWQPPKPGKVLNREEEIEWRKEVILAYLEQWGDVETTELERIGIKHGSVSRFLLNRPGVKRVEYVIAQGNRSAQRRIFYVLERERAK